MIEIDSIDEKIINLLRQNCKLSAQQLSEQVGASSASCWRRIKSLEDNGVITGYEAQVNFEEIGFELTAFVQVTLNRHSKKNVSLFEEAVTQIPEILSCHSVTGQHDYIIQIQVKNIRDYDVFLNEHIFQLPGVDHAFSSVSLKTIKAGQRVTI